MGASPCSMTKDKAEMPNQTAWEFDKEAVLAAAMALAHKETRAQWDQLHDIEAKRYIDDATRALSAALEVTFWG